MSGQQFSVLNSLSSLKAQKDLYFTNMGLNRTLARLSSGRRIVSAADDAAGLTIAMGLRADTLALSQGVRNANDGIAIVQIADGALNKMGDLLLRGVTLAEQAASDTVGMAEKETLNVEFQEILKELDRMVSVTSFKGERLFSVANAVTKRVFVGDTHFSSFLTISIGGLRGASLEALGLMKTCVKNGSVECKPGDKGCKKPGTINCVNPGEVKISIIDQDLSVVTLRNLQTAIISISRFRGSIGAQQNRLINAIGTIETQVMNLKAAESTIMDANMAEEIVNLTKYQILMQSGMSALAQSNASAQMVLGLLR